MDGCVLLVLAGALYTRAHWSNARGGSTAVAESGALPPHRGRGRSRHAHSQPDRIITLGVKTTRAAWGGDGKKRGCSFSRDDFLKTFHCFYFFVTTLPSFVSYYLTERVKRDIMALLLHHFWYLRTINTRDENMKQNRNWWIGSLDSQFHRSHVNDWCPNLTLDLLQI